MIWMVRLLGVGLIAGAIAIGASGLWEVGGMDTDTFAYLSLLLVIAGAALLRIPSPPPRDQDREP